MKIAPLQIDKLITERLILVPFTIQICQGILNDEYNELLKRGFKKGISWPDEDVLETIPKIINNLSKVEAPTGFESWMIIKKNSLEIIGDLGFKGFNYQKKNADLGYGIIKDERRKGYAEEASTAIMQWAFSNNMVKEITANCLIDNLSSINLLKKLKFIEIKRENDTIFWSLQTNSTNRLVSSVTYLQ